jgi:hypothetical protein
MQFDAGFAGFGHSCASGPAGRFRPVHLHPISRNLISSSWLRRVDGAYGFPDHIFLGPSLPARTTPVVGNKIDVLWEPAYSEMVVERVTSTIVLRIQMAGQPAAFCFMR